MTALMAMGLSGFAIHNLDAQDRLPEYIQAEKFTQNKINTMLFSTTVDPHWFQQGNCFWYTYKTSEGTFWYVVDPVKKTKNQLFDRDEMASQLTEIVKDPFEARHLPIANLKAGEDGRTFTFEVTSSKDAKPDKDKKDKKKGPKKEVFYFSYDYPTQKLTWLEDKEEEPKRLRWGSISPDKKTVIYAKDMNLYRMSYEDYLKAKKDEKDSTIVETQLTFDGQEDFGYGIPRKMINTDTLCNGKRRGVYGYWSPDSRHFAITVTDNRAVKDLWVLNVMSEPRPTLETYKYQMPGEKEAPVMHLYLFDMQDNSRKEIRIPHIRTRPSASRQDLSSRSRGIWRKCHLYGRGTTTDSSSPAAAATFTASTYVHTQSAATASHL